MSFDLNDLLAAIGPSASLIFAAWIFLSVLQQRYLSAYERYRAMLDEYRTHQVHVVNRRQESMFRQIRLYKTRCEQMKRATNLGVSAAILLIVTLIAGALNVVVNGSAVLAWIGAVGAIGGLLMVVWAATLVIRENTSLQSALDLELDDIPEFTE